jgi:signal transduction histidine kinase
MRHAELCHEMRNGLAGLKGNLLLLRTQELPPSAGETLERIARIADSLERLAQSVLEESRLAPLRPGGHPGVAKTGTCRPQEVLSNLASDYFPLAGDSLRIRLDPELPEAAIPGELLAAAVVNLSRNAFEAGARVVRIDGTHRHRRIRIRVRDDGPGCPSEALPRLFEPGFRLGKSPGGAGLGLHIVKSFLEDSGGVLTASLAAGGDGSGMVFTLHLPAVRGL